MSPLSFLQRPARWLQAISHFKATHSVAPNFAYELCVQKLKPEEVSELDLRTWTVAVNGAEPVRDETMDRFAAKFGPCGFRYDSFCPGYGLAEATLKVTAVRKGETPKVLTVLRSSLERGRVLESGSAEGDSRNLVGCGTSMIDTRVVIVNPERFELCQPEEVGEIWLVGSTITRGYWNRPSETESTFGAHLADGKGPFLRTGDLGFVKDGALFITGRLKDLILIRGQNHYPQDIERVSEESHPALKKPGFCAAFSVEYNNEERLVVVQELGRPGADLDWDDIVGSIRQAISEEHDLQAYRIVLVKPGGVPRTTSGKVQRRACREAFLAGALPVLYE
jgi:acyl-CoA synthetase (AMP-forming)/AMP-acid ligase II